MEFYTNNSIFYEFVAEIIGTGILVLFGLSSCASNIISKQNSIFIPGISFGVGAIIAIYLAGPISGAHINPAVSIGFCLIGKLSFRKLPVYVAGQMLGSFVASMIVYLLYYEALRHLDVETTASIFISGPANSISIFSAFLNELLATALLVLAILAITDEAFNRTTLAIQSLTIGVVIAGLVVAFFYSTGAILNPARDLAPRIFLSLVGYYEITFHSLNGHFWWVVAILGPIAGGASACLLYQWFAKIRTVSLEEKQKVIPIRLEK